MIMTVNCFIFTINIKNQTKHISHHMCHAKKEYSRKWHNRNLGNSLLLGNRVYYERYRGVVTVCLEKITR